MSRVSPPGVSISHEQRPMYPAEGPRRRSGPPVRRKPPAVNRQRLMRRGALIATVACETALLLVALVPQNVWADHGLPDGPIPTSLEPLVAGLFYLLPTLTGILCSRWQMALVLATLPAWLDLGVFAVAAASKVGPFYLVVDPHAVSTVGTLELFGALGALGWLARVSALGLWARVKGGRR
jgi:hypothetical protein